MISTDDIKKVAHLARIAVKDAELANYSQDLSGIFTMVDQLNAVDLTDVAPMTSVADMHQRMRDDVVDMPNNYNGVLSNAPESIILEESGYYIVPKVVG